jgi:hypothetical protein
LSKSTECRTFLFEDAARLLNALSAAAIEQVVVEQLQRLAQDPERTPEQRRVLAPFADPAARQALPTEEQTRATCYDGQEVSGW